MRLVFVLNSPVWGGVERYTVDLSLGLARRGHEVHMLTPGSGRVAAALEGTEVLVTPVDLGLVAGWHSAIGPLNEPLFFADLRLGPAEARLGRIVRRIAEDGPIDLLHAQFVKEKLWVTRLGQRLGVPVAWTVHAPLEWWMTRGTPRKIHAWARDKVDGMIAVNRAAAESYASFGFPPSRVIHNGIPLDLYASGDRVATRTSLGLGEDAVVVLLPARPYIEKGVGVLLEAVQLLRERESLARLRFFVAGESRHRPAFAQQALDAGLGEVVTFLGDREDMPDLYAASDIVILPSFNEGLPYVLSEAMAASRPVVATDVGGVAEMVDAGVNGLLIPPREAAPLADALSVLLRDAEMRRRMGEAGRRIAEERFTLERMLDETEAYFQQMADSRR